MEKSKINNMHVNSIILPSALPNEFPVYKMDLSIPVDNPHQYSDPGFIRGRSISDKFRHEKTGRE